MSREFHSTPFDEATKLKLSLYRDYLRQWIPVFLASARTSWRTVNIFDFFAGPGRDQNGVPGSPLIALEELFPYRQKISEKGITVRLYLNEFSQEKFKLLEREAAGFAGNFPVKLVFASKNFSEAFDGWYPEMSGSANLLFLDQQGIKHVPESIFKKIVGIPATDFLFFVASSFFRRFSEHEAFQKYVQLSKEELDRRSSNDIHRLVLDYYRELIPTSRPFYLAPFSIKKGANIYGLIFGSSHWLGMIKFLTSCWTVDPARGEANFDIDDDRISPNQPSLFGEMDRPKKLDLYEEDLASKIRSREIDTNKAAIVFSLNRGFLPRHAKVVISNLMRDGVVEERKITMSREAMKKKPVKIELVKAETGEGVSDERLDSN